MMDKEQLVDKIYDAFRGVKLENGIGLWEAQGHDDRLSFEECKKLRQKDEKEDWRKIPLIDLFKCNSSLSFFDAKGMRFHLPILLLFAMDQFEKEENELYKKGLVEMYLAPDVEFHLLSALKYVDSEDEMEKSMKLHHDELFSLLNVAQIDCIIGFLRFCMVAVEEHYQHKFAKEMGTDPSAVQYDAGYLELQRGIEYWTEKMNAANKRHGQ